VYVGMEEVSEGEEEDGRRRWCERNRRERVVSGELGAMIEGEIRVRDERRGWVRRIRQRRVAKCCDPAWLSAGCVMAELICWFPSSPVL